MTETPVLDTLGAMTAASIDQFSAAPDALILIRLAALVAVDAPTLSYLSQVGIAADLGISIEDVQNVLVAVAPIVGTARVVSAARKISEAFGIAVAVVAEELQEFDAAED
ncbi:MAG: carboxymuconolactone decarboxylase [Frankiales bacterium]|jgi:hypothetical protein|nr:carboxymuconolactone decarboxylase [Frankiales bacterium]